MGKSANKTIVEQLEPIVNAANVLADEQATMNATLDDARIWNRDLILDSEVIGVRVRAAAEATYAIFVQDELRAEADNGKFYSPGWALPDGVCVYDEHGEVCEDPADAHLVPHNIYSFDARDMLAAFVNKLERKVDACEEKVTKQRGYFKRLLEKASRTPEAVTERNIEVAASILEREIESQARALCAFRASLQAYDDLTGTAYETKAMRSEAERTGAQIMRTSPTVAKYKHLLG